MTKKELEKVEKDCWSLDFAFLRWLQPRLRQYLKDADKVIDLNYHKFKIYGKKMTQKEIVQRMIYLCDRLVKDGTDSLYWADNKEWFREQRELCALWLKVMPSMWL